MSIQTLDLLYDKLSEAHEKITTLNLSHYFGVAKVNLLDVLKLYATGDLLSEDLIESINTVFSDRIFPSLLNRFREYAIYGVRFGSAQLNDVYKGKINSSLSLKSIKRTETLVVDWSLVEQSVVDYIGNEGIDRSWYSMFVSQMLRSNTTMINEQLQAFVRGETDLTELHNNLSQLLYSDDRARRIVRTSLTDVFASGQQEAYRKAGTRKNRWYTKNDKVVCPYCQPLNGMEVEIGSPFDGRFTKPPLHISCRCYLSPVPLKADELFSKIDTRLQKRGVSEKYIV